MEEPVQNNLQKLSVYIILTVVNLIAFWVYIQTPPLHSDYGAFYLAGQTAREAPTRIYDFQYQVTQQIQAFNNFVPFFHPPQELLLFAPFSKLPFLRSFHAWQIFSLLCLVASGLLLGKAIGTKPVIAVAIVAAIFPIGICLELGQDSLLLLLVTSGCFYLLRKDADIAAGLVLSLALFKPQLPLILAIALLAFGRTKFAAAFSVAAAALTAGSIAYMGRAGVRGFLFCTKVGGDFLPIFRMPTMRGIIALILGDHQRLALVLLTAVVAIFWHWWRRSRLLEFVFATAICVYCFAAPHLFAHDLAVLAVPVMLVSNLSRRPKDPLLLIAFFSAPLFIILYYFDLSALITIPTICLCVACFRLNHGSPTIEDTPHDFRTSGAMI